MGTVTPGSGTINKVIVNTRIIQPYSRIRVKIRFDAMEKRKPTANYAVYCIDVMLLRHVTVYRDALYLGIVHLLSGSTIDLDIECRADEVRRYCRVLISKDLVLVVLSDIRLLSAHVDTVLTTSFS